MNDYFYTHFDHMFEDIFSKSFGSGFEPEKAMKQHSSVNLPSFPPCDCLVTEDRNKLVLRFAMAGYSKEDVAVTAAEGSISLNATCKGFGPKERPYLFVHHGISSKDINTTIGIDTNYDAKKAEVLFENGILWVEVPAKEEAKSVKLM